MKLSGVRVLLAEDNPTNQLVAVQMLESLGAAVTLARDGAEALEIVERDDFDVMLIDIEMPRVSGIDVIRRIRAAPGPRAEMPLIALTAYVMPEHRAAIDAAGADGVIAKPILSIEQFGADIRRLMQGRAAPAGAAAGNRATPGAGACPVIDQEIYDALAQAIGPDATSELLGKVDEDVRAARDRLREALEAGDIDAIGSASHILISVAGAVGAARVAQGAKRINVAVHQRDLAAIRQAAPAMLEDIEGMLDFVGHRLNA